MRTPDPNSVDNRFIKALFGTYKPRSQFTSEEHKAYYRMMQFNLTTVNAERKKLINDITQAGLMSPALKEILKNNLPKTYKEI